MNANWSIRTTAVLLHTALTPLALIIALVMKDFMEMACYVRILMSAKSICTTAVFKHSAITLLALLIALVLKDFLEMVAHVRILMSAKTMLTIAIYMHSVITVLALIIALVIKDSMEMATHVRTLMSAKTMFTIAMYMHSAIIVLFKTVRLLNPSWFILERSHVFSLQAVEKDLSPAALVAGFTRISLHNVITSCKISIWAVNTEILPSSLYSFSITFSSSDLSCELRVLIKRDSIFAYVSKLGWSNRWPVAFIIKSIASKYIRL